MVETERFTEKNMRFASQLKRARKARGSALCSQYFSKREHIQSHSRIPLVRIPRIEAQRLSLIMLRTLQLLVAANCLQNHGQIRQVLRVFRIRVSDCALVDDERSLETPRRKLQVFPPANLLQEEREIRQPHCDMRMFRSVRRFLDFQRANQTLHGPLEILRTLRDV